MATIVELQQKLSQLQAQKASLEAEINRKRAELNSLNQTLNQKRNDLNALNLEQARLQQELAQVRGY